MDIFSGKVLSKWVVDEKKDYLLEQQCRVDTVNYSTQAKLLMNIIFLDRIIGIKSNHIRIIEI